MARLSDKFARPCDGSGVYVHSWFVTAIDAAISLTTTTNGLPIMSWAVQGCQSSPRVMYQPLGSLFQELVATDICLPSRGVYPDTMFNYLCYAAATALKKHRRRGGGRST